MLREIERVALFSIARGCGFAALAILTMMTGLSWDPPLAMKAGGLLSLLTCAVLVLKGFNARHRHYKHTELWIILPKEQRPPPDIAQQIVGNAIRDICFWLAQQAALLGTFMLLLAMLLRVSASR